MFEKNKQISKKKTLIICITAAVVVAAILICILVFSDKKSENQSKQPQKTTKVRETLYSTSIDVSGAVEAFDIQNVKIRATGTVTKVCVTEGDRVRQGDLLATIDDTDQQYDVANMEKQIQSAKVSGSSSDREIQLLEMKLKSAEKKLDNTRAYANFDGVVVSVSIDEGDYFEAGDEVMTLIDDSKLIATVEIDEIDIQMVKEGDIVSITSDSSPGEAIQGYVSYVPMIGRYSSQGIGVMDVEITIDNPPQTLKPGFSFEGIIEIKTETAMLLVSQTAVTTRRGISTLTKLNEDGTTEEVTVQVKYLGENLYQILSGDIKDGDTVVCNTTAGMNNPFAGGLTPGMTGGMSQGGAPNSMRRGF